MAIINEIATKFSFLGKITPLTSFNANMDVAVKKIFTFSASIEAFSLSLATFASYVANSNRGLIQLAQNSNISISNIQAMGFAATQLGSSTDAMQSTLESLTNNIADASLHGSEAFARLGIDIRKNNGDLKTAQEVLFEVGKNLQRMGYSRTQQQSLASGLGIDKSLITLLNTSEQSLNSLMNKAKQLGTINNEGAKAMDRLNRASSVLKFGLNSVKNSIAVALVPNVENLIKTFVDFLTANKELITEGIKKFVNILTVVIDSLHRVVPIIVSIIGVFVALRVATFILTGAFTVLLSPVYLIVGAIAGAILIIDDLIVAFKGGNSVIANFAKNVLGIDIQPILKNLVTSFTNFFNFVKDITIQLGNIFKDLFTGNFTKLFKDLMTLGKTTVTYLYNLFKPLIDYISNLFKPILDTLGSIGNFISSKFGKFLGLGNSSSNTDKDSSQLPVNTMRMNPTNNSNINTSNTNNTSNVNQTIQINVESINPIETANTIQDTLQLQLRDTQNQYRKGNR